MIWLGRLTMDGSGRGRRDWVVGSQWEGCLAGSHVLGACWRDKTMPLRVEEEREKVKGKGGLFCAGS